MHISFQIREIKESPSLCIEEDIVLRKTIEIGGRRVGIFLDPVMSPPPPHDAPLILQESTTSIHFSVSTDEDLAQEL
ncbi:hypothetical protein LXL04_007740 [Taraxacum kok-saghyz]